MDAVPISFREDMPMPPANPYIPSVRARRLARILKESREKTAPKLGQGTVAARLGWSQGKVSHIESGRNKPDVYDVELLLDIYEVASPESDAILALAREVERRGWWTDYKDILDGPYVALEDEASEICHWAPLVIPGLFQTHDYAREIINTGEHESPEAIERRLKARANRQTLVTRENAPRLRVVIDEAVLERPIGGVDVMRDQLYRLRSEARRPNVEIQVLPKAVGSHAGLDGSLIVLRFPDPADLDVAYSEGFHGAVYLESQRKVRSCSVAFERLCAAALDVEASAALIDVAAKR